MQRRSRERRQRRSGLLAASLIVTALALPWSRPALAEEPRPGLPRLPTGVTTLEDQCSDPIPILPNENDGAEVTQFQIRNVYSGMLYAWDCGWPIVFVHDVEWIATIDASEGALGVAFMPDNDLSSDDGYTFAFQVRAVAPAYGVSDWATLELTVHGVNDPPEPEDDFTVAFEDTTLVIPFADVLKNDRPGPAGFEKAQTLELVEVKPSQDGDVVVDSEREEIEFTPKANFFTTQMYLEYVVRDNGTTAGKEDPKEATGRIYFPVLPVPDAPTITGAPTNEDTPTTLYIHRSSHDGDEVTHFEISDVRGGRVYKWVSGKLVEITPEDPLITVQEGQAGVVFVPGPDLNKDWPGVTFTFTVKGWLSDEHGERVGPGAEARIEVREVNDPPVAVDDTWQTQVQGTGPWVIPFDDLLANDLPDPPDEWGQELEVSRVLTDPNDPEHGPVGGAVYISGHVVIFTPYPNFTGTAAFSYYVQDHGADWGGSNPKESEKPARVTFEVVPPAPEEKPEDSKGSRANRRPQAQESSITLRVGEQYTGRVTGADPDGDHLTFSLERGPSRGELTFEPDGSFTYTAREAGSDRFTFRVSDGSLSDTATVSITILPVPVVTITAPVTETREGQITVSGTADPGATVQVNGQAVTAGADGRWSAVVELVEGENRITAMSGPSSASVVVVRDTVPPPITLTAPAERTAEAEITLTAVSEEGATVTIEGVEGPSLTVPLQIGTNRFTATATDRVGNQATAEITIIRYRTRYEDTAGHWAEADINHLAELGILSLYPTSLFGPEERVTRLEAAAMVARALNLAPASDPPPFTDAGEIPDWALPKVAAAAKAGIIKGMPDGSFAPNRPISRAEMAVMMTRALAYAGLDTTPGENRFTDGGEIPEWALQEVLAAARHGLITGYPDSSFRAASSATRAEAVTVLRRLLNLVSP